MKRLIFILLCLLTAAPAMAQLYHPGEQLHYRVSYRAKLVPNTEMASVSISTVEGTMDGRRAYKVTGYGCTLAIFRWFFNLEDTYTVWVDPQTLRTMRFEGDVHEGKYTFASRYDYDWERLEVRTWWQSRQKTPRTKTLKISERSMDPVSLYFNLRGINADSLRTGETRKLEMVLEDTVRTLNFRFLGREVKKLPKRGTYRTLKFACEIGTSDGFSFTDGSEFTVWISDDGNKIPVYMESPVRVGSVCVSLSSFSGLKYPLESRMD